MTQRFVFQFSNDAAVGHFGYSHQEFLAMTITDICPPEAVPCLHRVIESLATLATVGPQRTDAEGVWKLRRKDGMLRDVELTWSPIAFGGRAAELVLAHDITERKKAEESLRRRTQELETMVALANSLAGLEPFEVKANRMLVEINALAAGDMAALRLPAEAEPGLRTVADSGLGPLNALPLPLIRPRQSISMRAYELGAPVVVNDYAVHPRARPSVVAQGVNAVAAFPLQVGAVTLGTVTLTSGQKHHFTPDRVQLLAAVAHELGVLVENARLQEETKRRLAELHSAHEQLQDLSQRLLEIQEMERRHIARELHDEIGQLLTAMQLLLDAAEQSSPDTVATNLHRVQALVHELMGRVRNLSLNLRPPMLDDLGLLPTLLWHFKRYTDQSDVAVDFQHAGLEGRRFRTDIETAAYRIVQEALTNVARHAKVKHAAIRIRATYDTFGIQIEERGVGFDPHAVSVGSHGLVGMRERARMLGGTLTIEAAPGAGTRVTAEWPLADHHGREGHERDHRPGG